MIPPVSQKDTRAVPSLVKRRSKIFYSWRDWLEEGMSLLEEVGAEALTIETLTNRLSVTKGSFYHHFKNYQAFKEHLLTFYEEERTLQIIR